MKYKKIMTIFAIILVAFMVIGAVSASEDVSNDELAASDITEDSIGETTVDDVIAETPEQTTGTTADDFNAWIANKTFDVDNDKDEVVINFTSPADAKGEVQIWANEKYKTAVDIDESTAGKTFYWALNNLYISQAGVYDISLRYNSEGGGQLEIATGTFTVAKNYSKADFTTTTFDYIGTTGTRIYSFNPAPVYGTLIVFVDGKESYNKYINDKYTYLQLYVNDLNITENGVYNIRTEYIVEDSGQVVALDDFNSSVECMPVAMGITDMDIDVAAGYTASLGYVSDENVIQGPVTVYIGSNQVFNKEYALSDNKYYISLNEYTLPEGFALGNHTVKITYTRGNKEYSKQGIVSFYADPEVINPGYTMTAGDDKNITVKYYKGTTGTITVYNTEKNSTAPGGWQKSTIFMNTAELNGSGIFYVPLNTLDVGYHGLCLNITLGTYSVEKFADFNVVAPVDPRPEVVITVDNPCIVDYGSSNITVKTEGAVNISAKISGKSLEVSGNTIFINGFNASSDPYYLVITPVPDADHKAGSPKAVPLYVNPLKTSITVPKIDDAAIGQEVTIVANVNSTLTVDDGKVAFTDDNGDDIGEAPVVNGTATIKYTPTATGTLHINADYTGNNFKSAFGVGLITVSKAKLNLTIDPVQTVFITNSSNFKVNVMSNSKKVTGGEVYYYVDEELIGHSAVNDGVSTYSYTAGKTGTFDLEVIYMETGNYSSANASTTFTVQKVVMLTEINASDVTAPYNGGKFLIATLTDIKGNPIANATVSVDINKDVSNFTTDSAGQIKFPCDGIDPGVYVADIIFKGNDNYFEAKKSVNVTVEKVETKFVVDVENIEAGQVAYINVTLNSTASGNVALIFDKQNYTEEIVNGKALFKIADLAVGNYTFEAVYGGDKYFKNISSTKSIEVSKVNITSVELPEHVSEKDPEVSFDLPADAKGNVTLSINGTDYPATVKDGKVNIKLSELARGTYPYNVSYTGDDKYNPFTQSGVLTVEDIDTSISITKINGDCTVEGVLKDSEGKGIANATLTVKMGSSNLTTKTVENGVFSFQAKDNSLITIAFAGKDSYLPSDAEITLNNINPVRQDTAIIAQDYNTKAIDYYAGERGGYFEVTLTDGSKPIANKAVKIGFNGKVYNTTTDEKGLARLQINLGNAGTYTFAVAFLGDDDYKGAFVVQKITVTKKTTSITAAAKSYKASAKTKSYTVTLKTEKGSSIDGKTYLRNGKTVKLTVNGKTYTAKTNAKGQATFKLDITKKGTYTANINFAGDNGYQASKASAKITIN